MSKKKGPDEVKAKLSKKIVELSIVVQALFTRNHEKELELMATKKSCEEEMKLVIDEGKSKLNWLEKQLDDLERFRTLLEMKTEECERTKTTVEMLNEKQLEAEKKVSERGVMLNNALTEIENLRQEITNQSPEQLERLQREKQALTLELAGERSNLVEKNESVRDLRNRVNSIEANLKGMMSDNDKLKNECSRLQEELSGATDEIKDLSLCLQDARRQGERALQRTRKLEENNKHTTAEKKLLVKHNEQLNEQVSKLLMEQQFRDKPILTKPIRPSSPRKVEVTASMVCQGKSRLIQKEDEVQKLKREIEKYRLELKNREANFNRVFAEKNPLVIKKPPEITAEELRLRNFTGLTGYNKKNFPVLPSVVQEAKPNSYGYHQNRTRR